MFRSVLIANRGEIACRIQHTARAMGLRTIAVYSEADRRAQHVLQADAAIEIGPAAAAESYLVQEKILEAARRTGAEAIHPGYGFLSENATFAEACECAGIRFVGPTAAAIRAMGLKDAAKALMQKADVPVVPGYHGAEQGAGLLAEAAGDIGFPVLIKAVAGGGGKGMRRVDSAAEFPAALEAAQREAKAAFGDDRVLVEKLLLKPRHIEVQVFADTHGNAVHLFERDCSLQRRHQKVVEEAPAPGMQASMRQAMGEAAVRAAKSIGYVGAGTCEFIVDVEGGLAGAPFYFMEMNTRLQVEHPVTEAISDTDLVEWQLRVAAGEPLPASQEQLAITGHAVEVRVYAEDAARDYMPQTGVLQHLRLPEGAGVRVDSGVVQGDEVSIHYDPMIAKLVTHGRDRDEALRRMSRALEGFEVAGVVTNLPLLAAIARHPEFVAGNVDTGFLGRHQAELIPEQAAGASGALAALGTFELLTRQPVRAVAAAIDADADVHSPWGATDAYRLNQPRRDSLHFRSAGEETVLQVEIVPGGYDFEIGGTLLRVRDVRLIDGQLAAAVDGVLQRWRVVDAAGGVSLLRGSEVHRFERVVADHVGGAMEGQAGALLAPMPGKVLAVLVEQGETVAAGQALVRLEAMKMEHTLTAGADGNVESLRVAAGDQVDDGDVLLVLAADPDSSPGSSPDSSPD